MSFFVVPVFSMRKKRRKPTNDELIELPKRRKSSDPVPSAQTLALQASVREKLPVPSLRKLAKRAFMKSENSNKKYNDLSDIEKEVLQHIYEEDYPEEYYRNKKAYYLGNNEEGEAVEARDPKFLVLPPKTIFNRQAIDFFSQRNAKLKSLTFFCHLSSIPAFVCKFKQLKEFYFSSLNLKSFPKNMSALQHLESLSLPGCNLKRVPDFIFKLSGLKKLNLSQNDIKEIPDTISQFGSLRALLLHENNIETIPVKTLSVMKKLRTLTLFPNFDKVVVSEQIKEAKKALEETNKMEVMIYEGNSHFGDESGRYYEEITDAQPSELASFDLSELSDSSELTLGDYD